MASIVASLRRPSSASRRRAGRGGFALMLVMLVIVVLSGVGLYALRTSRIDQKSAGNLRMANQTEFIAEAAMQQAVLQMLQNPSGVLSVLTNGASYTIPYSSGMFGENTSTYDTFGFARNADNQPTSMPQWSVVLSRAMDVSPIAMTGTMIGSVGGTTSRFRMKRIDVAATGSLAQQGFPDDGGTGQWRAMSNVMIRAHVIIGPL